MKQFSASRSLLLDRAIISSESGKWWGRMWKRFVEWLAMGGKL